MPLSVSWAVRINGQSYTDRFNPYVHEIEVTDGDGDGADTCRITLADDGRIIMPKPGAEIEIDIEGVRVFRGILKTPRHTIAKGQGGFLTLNAAGHDTEGPGKQGSHFAKEDCSLGEYLREFGKTAGYNVKVDPSFDEIKRPWWGAEGRSFFHHFNQLAGDHGATRKISGKTAVLAKRGKGKTPSGQDLPTIRVTCPGNFLSSEIEPYNATEAFRDVRFTYFDRKKAKFEEEKADVRLGPLKARAAKVMRGRAGGREEAKDRSAGRANDSERDRGGGSVEILIEPQARAESTCILSGVRQGIDGEYRIESVTHTLTAGDGGGATTKLTLKQPGDEAGSDSRKAGDEG